MVSEYDCGVKHSWIKEYVALFWRNLQDHIELTEFQIRIVQEQPKNGGIYLKASTNKVCDSMHMLQIL